jgi:type II secretory pathway component PulJ
MKYKTIKISESLHKEIKTACKKNGQKLNWWCEIALTDAITDWNGDHTWVSPLRVKLQAAEKELIIFKKMER